jgi:hypothetical protein
MVSRENAVIAASIALAFVLLYALTETNTLTSTSGSAVVLLGVGVVLPTLLNELLNRRENA